jgi:hypothetical protein
MDAYERPDVASGPEATFSPGFFNEPFSCILDTPWTLMGALRSGSGSRALQSSAVLDETHVAADPSGTFLPSRIYQHNATTR